MNRGFAQVLIGLCLVLMGLNALRGDWFGFILLGTAVSLLVVMPKRIP